MTKTSKINLIDLAGSERAYNVLNDQIMNSPEVQSLRLKVSVFNSYLASYKIKTFRTKFSTCDFIVNIRQYIGTSLSSKLQQLQLKGMIAEEEEIKTEDHKGVIKAVLREFKFS